MIFASLSSTSIVAYSTLFTVVAFLFVFGALLLGRFIRANNPSAEKMETYECGEPAVGSGYLQFNLRFYVIALVFLIFDIEVALFFPWATVYGKAAQLRQMADKAETLYGSEPADAQQEKEFAEQADQRRQLFEAKYAELGTASPELPDPQLDAKENSERIGEIHRHAGNLALASLADMGVFFGVLLVGFAYVWWQGDLDWIRTVRRESPTAGVRDERLAKDSEGL